MRVSDSETQFVDKAGLDHAISELKAYIDGLSNGSIDLTDYVTKNELQAKLDALEINIDLSAYATKEELTNAIDAIDLSVYATKGEIPSLDGYATTEYVDNAIADIPTGGTTDLSNYYTKEETDALIPTVTNGKDGTDGVDGITPHIDNATKHWMIGDTDTGVMAEGINGVNGADGTNGIDGVSPTVTVTKEGSVATITCTDVNGTTTATISDGEDGGSGGGSSVGSGEIYSTEETAIGTWIDGKTVYRKVISMDLPSVSSSNNYGQKTIVGEPCNIMLLNWRAIYYAGATGSNYEYTLGIMCGDGLKGTDIWTSVTMPKTMDKNKLTVFHVGNPIRSYINCYYGSSFGGKRCDFILEYIKVV